MSRNLQNRSPLALTRLWITPPNTPLVADRPSTQVRGQPDDRACFRSLTLPPPMRRSDIAINPDIFAAPKRELTDRQQRFVDAYVTNGGESGPAAAEAGYSTASAVQAASQLLRKPLIQQAILKRTMSAIGLQAVPALAVISKLMASSKSDYVRLEAARDLLDRSGFQPPERVDHRLDSGLTVTIEFGGSKTGTNSYVTVPDTGKGSQKLVPQKDSGRAKSGSGPDFAGETLDLPAIVNNSTSHDVVFSKTEEEE